MHHVWHSTILVKVEIDFSSSWMRVLEACVGWLADLGLVAAAYDLVGLGCVEGAGEGVSCGGEGEGRGDWSLRRRVLADFARLKLSDREAAVAKYSLALDGSAW